MSTINEFLSVNNPAYELNISELMCVKGGDTPVKKPSNPFIRKVADFFSMLSNFYSTYFAGRRG
ncbi:MAG: hypothetical protein K9H26_06620 [Prolixibacteraceae bacterium]|nr:hypothetical protein [Prolixibacteraceae bacterium]